MAKTDMERIGLFSEPGYISIKDNYYSSYRKPFNVKAGEGKQMLVGSTKSKTAFLDGYFSATFDRVMEGEAYTNMVQQRRQQRLKEAKYNVDGVFIPANVPKKASGLGGYYGTLGGRVDTFSAATRPREKYRPPGKNVLVNPSKKGTGYGYVGLCIGPNPLYQSEPYNRAMALHLKYKADSKKRIKNGPFLLNSHPKDVFDDNPYREYHKLPPLKDAKPHVDTLKPFRPSNPAKLIGGCKAGTFDPYPLHSEEPYQLERRGKGKKNLLSGFFKPSAFPKSRPTTSIVQQNVDKRINKSNFLTTITTT